MLDSTYTPSKNYHGTSHSPSYGTTHGTSHGTSYGTSPRSLSPGVHTSPATSGRGLAFRPSPDSSYESPLFTTSFRSSPSFVTSEEPSSYAAPLPPYRALVRPPTRAQGPFLPSLADPNLPSSRPALLWPSLSYTDTR